MGLLSKIKGAAVKALDTNAAFFSNPVTFVTKGATAAVTQMKTQTVKETVARQVGTTAVLAAGVLTAGTATGAAVAKTVAKSVIPTSAKGKVIAAVATPVVIGAVVREPVKSATAAIKAPTELSKFGGDLASFAASPSISTGKALISESPIIAAAAGLVVAGSAAKVIAPAVGGYLQKEAIEEQTQVIKESGTKGIQPVTVIDKSSEFVKESPTAPVTPIMPQTNTVTSGTSKVRRKARRKPVLPNMIQKVNVLVSNNNTNKRYIKGAAVAF